jgi:hypothetical protein
LNNDALNKAQAILQYANQRTQAIVELDFDVKDKNTRFTYSEMLSFIELANGKQTDVTILKANLITVAPPKTDVTNPTPAPTTQTFTSLIPYKKMKVQAYKMWLQQELQKLANAHNDDDIILTSANENL